MTLEELYNYVLKKENELKPCPFCGSHVVINIPKARKGYTCNIYCDNCFISMDGIYYDAQKKAIDEVVKKWNTRTKEETDD